MNGLQKFNKKINKEDKDTLEFIRKRFITGLFVVLPMGITIAILWKFFSVVDSILGSAIYKFLGREIPGIGFLVTIVLIIGVGIVTNNVAGRSLAIFIERLFTKTPVIKEIYCPIRDIVNNFSSKQSNNFKKVALVTYPLEGSQSIGFITKEHVIVDGKDCSTIFIPTTPNPTSGFLVFLEKDNYKELDIAVEDALKTVISLGSISPDILKIRENKDEIEK